MHAHAHGSSLAARRARGRCGGALISRMRVTESLKLSATILIPRPRQGAHSLRATAHNARRICSPARSSSLPSRAPIHSTSRSFHSCLLFNRAGRVHRPCTALDSPAAPDPPRALSAPCAGRHIRMATSGSCLFSRSSSSCLQQQQQQSSSLSSNPNPSWSSGSSDSSGVTAAAIVAAVV